MLRSALLGLSLAITAPLAHADDEADATPKKASQGRILVVSSKDLEVYRLEALDPGSAGWQTIARTGPVARLSPDGRVVALGRRGFVFTIPLKPRPTATALGTVGSLDLPEIYAPHVAWCPDGKSMIASGILDVDPDVRYETFLCDSKMGMRDKMSVPATDFVLDVSPDGEWLLTSGKRGQGPWRMYRRRLDGTGEVALTRWGCGVGRFSPDGAKVLCTRADPDATKAGTFIMDIDGKNLRRVHPVAAPACWGPDGERLAFAVENRPAGPSPAPPEGVDAFPVRIGGLEPEAIVGQIPAPESPHGRIEIVVTDLQGRRVSAHPTPTGNPVVNLDWR